MKRIKIIAERPHPDAIHEAVAALMRGGVVLYPTDTCYGLGVDARNATAVRRLIQMKGRDLTAKPFSVIVRSIDQMKSIAEVNEVNDTILHQHLPGPFTFVLINLDFRIARSSSIGIRIPSSVVTSMIAAEFGAPYTTTRANLADKPSPYSETDLESDLFLPLKLANIEPPDVWLDAGKLPRHAPSTVVDLTGLEPKILRNGSGKLRIPKH